MDLTNRRATAAHPAAKTSVPISRDESLRPPPTAQLPKICRQPTVTVRPGDLGKLDKFRQDRHYLHPTWRDAYGPGRANIEGLNGRAKTHGIDIADPTKRLAHGRVAQTILLALMIFSINLHILHSWHQSNGSDQSGTDTTEEFTALSSQPPATTGLSPPEKPSPRTT